MAGHALADKGSSPRDGLELPVGLEFRHHATVTNRDGFEGASMGNWRATALVIGIGLSNHGEDSMRTAQTFVLLAAEPLVTANVRGKGRLAPWRTTSP